MNKFVILFFFVLCCVLSYAQVTIPSGVYSNSSEPDFQSNVRVQDTIGVGMLYVNDVYRLPTVDGTNGYALITNGSGVASWSSIYNNVNVWNNGVVTASYTGEYAVSQAAYNSTAGDLIVVNQGSYTDTITRTEGLAEDSVNYYFMPNTLVTKDNDSCLFKCNGFDTPTNIFGYGSFSVNNSFYKTSSAQNKNIVIEFDSILGTANNTIYFGNANKSDVLIRGNKLRTALNGIFFSAYGNVKIDVGKVISSGGYAIRLFSTNTDVNCDYVSGTTYGIAIEKVSATATIAFGTVDIGYCYGGTYGMLFAFADISASGYANSLICQQNSSITFNGQVNSVTNSAEYFGSAQNFTQTSGYSRVKLMATQYNSYAGKFDVSGGDCNIDGAIGTGGNSSVSGTGNVSIIGKSTLSGGDYSINVSGGNLYIDGTLEKNSGNNFYPIVQSGGNVYIRGLVKTNTSSLGTSGCIKKTGGDLIIDGGTLIAVGDSAYPITATTSAQDIKVLSGGLNLTKETFVARKQNTKATVDAFVPPTLTINAESFVVSDTVTYDTKAKICEKMTDTINAIAVGNFRAYQDTPGTDEYFYIISTVAGTPFTYSGANFSFAIIKENNYTISEIIGGTVIVDTNVE